MRSKAQAESVRLVVGHGREAEAEHAVRRLQSSSSGVEIATPQETVALLAETHMIEKRLTDGVGYLECFKGTNLRRTEVSVGTWIVQQMCGPVLQTYAIYFFEQAGLAEAQAFNMSLGLVSFGVVSDHICEMKLNVCDLVRYSFCRNRYFMAIDQPFRSTDNLLERISGLLCHSYDCRFHRYRTLHQLACILGYRSFPPYLHLHLRFYCWTTYM